MTILEAAVLIIAFGLLFSFMCYWAIVYFALVIGVDIERYFYDIVIISLQMGFLTAFFFLIVSLLLSD